MLTSCGAENRDHSAWFLFGHLITELHVNGTLNLMMLGSMES